MLCSSFSSKYSQGLVCVGGIRRVLAERTNGAFRPEVESDTARFVGYPQALALDLLPSFVGGLWDIKLNMCHLK